MWVNSPPAFNGCAKQTLAVMPQQCALLVSSSGAGLASAAHSGSMRRRLITSVSCSLSCILHAMELANRPTFKCAKGLRIVIDCLRQAPESAECRDTKSPDIRLYFLRKRGLKNHERYLTFNFWHVCMTVSSDAASSRHAASEHRLNNSVERT